MSSIAFRTREEIERELGAVPTDCALGVRFLLDDGSSHSTRAEQRLKAHNRFVHLVCCDSTLATRLWICTTAMSSFARSTGFQRVLAPFRNARLPLGGFSPHAELADGGSAENQEFLEENPGSRIVDIWFADGCSDEKLTLQALAIKRYRELQSGRGLHFLVVALSERVGTFIADLFAGHDTAFCTDGHFDALFDLIFSLLKLLAKNHESIDLLSSRQYTANCWAI